MPPFFFTLATYLPTPTDWARMRVWVSILLLLVPAAVAASPAPPGGWWESTLQDTDGDRIDDALAALAPRELATVLVAFDRVPTADDREALAQAGFAASSVYAHFDVVAVRASPVDLPRLLRVPGVVFVEQDMPIERLLAQSVPLIGAPRVWKDHGATGEGITIAVLDDGAYEQHPDLSGKVRASFDASSPTAPGGLDVLGSVPVVPAGFEGHGTHVAGTIVGPGSQSNGRYKGVAPGADFVDVKVFSGPNRTSSEIVLRGLDWTLSNAERNGVRVVSMSIGGAPSDGHDALSRAVNVAVDKGLIVVAAAGNAGPKPGTIGSPGAAEKAITVGAVDKSKMLAKYSSRGPTADGRLKPEIVAPGSAITSTVPPSSTTSVSNVLKAQPQVFYGELSGTSMAAPHASGVIALMLEVNPDLTPFEVKQILVATAQDLGSKGRDNETGYGIVDAVAAARVAKDPTLLGSPQFAAALGTLGTPGAESFSTRAQVELESLVRTGKVWIVAAASAAVIALVTVAELARRRRA